VTPRLIHPVKIMWQQVDTSSTPPMDPQFREPTGAVVYTTNILTAQLGLGRTGQYYQRAGGDDPQSDGRVVIRALDLARDAPEGFALHKGDRITLLYAGTPDEQLVDWSVIEVRPQGHYRGRASFYFCFYKNLKTLAQVQ
jgi:hypothetical protein